MYNKYSTMILLRNFYVGISSWNRYVLYTLTGLNVPLKESCIVFIIQKHNIMVFSFDALFGLTWRMLTPCYNYEPVISRLYDHLVFDL
jgi:hypothetical protein